MYKTVLIFISVVFLCSCGSAPPEGFDSPYTVHSVTREISVTVIDKPDELERNKTQLSSLLGYLSFPVQFLYDSKEDVFTFDVEARLSNIIYEIESASDGMQAVTASGEFETADLSGNAVISKSISVKTDSFRRLFAELAKKAVSEIHAAYYQEYNASEGILTVSDFSMKASGNGYSAKAIVRCVFTGGSE